MPYTTLRNKKTELIRKARDGSAFIAASTATAITAITHGATSEVQTITVTGSPAGGTFTLTFGGQTTAVINHNATAGAVQTALEALSNVAAGGEDLAVTGGPGPATPWVVTFRSGGAYGGTNASAITADDALLTGGVTPEVTIAETTPGGVSAATDLRSLPSGYEDLGWVSSDGFTFGRETEISDVTSFGSVEPTRSDVTRDTITCQVTAQETKLLTLGLYTGAETTGLTATADSGEFSIAKPARPGFRYYRLLSVFVDDTDAGEIYMARSMPRARITEFGEQQFSDGDDPISYTLTFTGYEDSTLGYSHKWYWGGPGWEALLTSMGITQGV